MPPDPAPTNDPEPRTSAKAVSDLSEPLSEVLSQIAHDTGRERIAIGDLMTSLQHRAIGALLLIFAIPNALPAIPGTSGILGLPLIYLTFQLMLGRPPWLPKFITQQSLSREGFARLIDRVAPWLARAETLLRARAPALTGQKAQRVIGGFCLILSAVLALPIPLGNMMPALAICIFALGLLSKDGLWILAGAVIGLLSLVLVSGVIWAFIKTAYFVITHVLL